MASSPSNRDEIIELAQLEVVGALESVDCARLERLFRAASPLVQREVLDLQSILVTQTALLPVIEPERSLRLRVLASVAQAVEASDSELAPIASIGRPAPFASSSSESREPDGQTSGSTSIQSPADSRWRRSSMMWRATCIAVIGALVASLIFQIARADQATRISELALQNAISKELSALVGAGIDKFLDQRCIVKGLVGATVRDNGSATVMLTPSFDAVLLLWIDVPAGSSLTLQSLDRQSGIARQAGDFSVVNPIGGTRIDLPSGVANANSDWQVTDSRGTVIFTTRP
ncbi:MAG: hypothetical protein EXS01_03625 [Phycisphaerales bacterium]|nr:hypothetical protein [Phycisphaerales bacterium]